MLKHNQTARVVKHDVHLKVRAKMRKVLVKMHLVDIILTERKIYIGNSAHSNSVLDNTYFKWRDDTTRIF